MLDTLPHTVRSKPALPIFDFTEGLLTPYSDKHVVRQQTVQSIASRIARGQGISCPQLRWSRSHRKVQLRRRASQNLRGQFSYDRDSLHHAAGSVHLAVGRWISKILGIS